MARPSIKLQRREEILDAFESCVIRHGLTGATLQKVADESGLARPLIHHNVGSRDELLEALLERLDLRYEQEREEFRQHLPGSDRCRAMLDIMFDHRYATSSHEGQLYQALSIGAEEHPNLQRSLNRWYGSLLADIEYELLDEHPQAETTDVRAIATGVIALYFNAESMALVTDRRTVFQDSKRAAQRLVETLKWNG
ncbi:MAG: TetR family transcriptional regulator [Pseudomonadota bacterium]